METLNYIVAFQFHKSRYDENLLAFLSILLYIWDCWILCALAKRKGLRHYVNLIVKVLNENFEITLDGGILNAS